MPACYRTVLVLPAYAVLMAAMGVVNTTSALRVSELAGPWAGTVMGLYYAGFIGGALLVGRLASRVGYVWAVRLLVALLTLCSLIQASADETLVWMLCRFGSGIGMVGVFVSLESSLNTRTPDMFRGRVFGVYMAAGYIGDALGQFALRGSPFGFVTNLAGASLLLMATILPLATTCGATADQQSAVSDRVALRPAARWLLASRPQGVMAVLIAGFFVGGHFSTAPSYLKLSGFDTSRLLSLMGWSMCAALAFQFPVGRLADHIGRVRVMRLSLALVMLLSVLLVLGSQPNRHGVAFVATVGLMTTIYPTAVGFINDGMPGELRASASAILLALYSIGATLGPLILRLVMDHGGGWAYFCAITVVSMLGFIAWAGTAPGNASAGLASTVADGASATGANR